MPFSKRFLVFLYILLLSSDFIAAQKHYDDTAFSSLSNSEDRIQYLTELNFPKLDSTATMQFLQQIIPLIVEKKDVRTYLYCQYLQFSARGKLKLSYDQIVAFLQSMAQKSVEEKCKVEELVALHYLNFEQFHAKKISVEQQYANVLQHFERMEIIGFEQFKFYHVEALLLHMGNFMFELEDNEKAVQYLKLAEKYIQETPEGELYFTRVLSNLQNYYKNKKEYQEALAYAKRIYDFHYKLNPSQDTSNWKSRFWQGLSSLDIASMMIEIGQVKESEAFSTRSYELCKIQKSISDEDVTNLLAEYDALQVLIEIKLKLGKVAEAGQYLKRTEDLSRYFTSLNAFNYFKPLKMYRNYIRYYEANNDMALAHKYTLKAELLQDSLNRRNDAHKLEAIKQRVEAEKYFSQIQLVEEEKKIQQWIMYISLVIMIGISLAAYLIYRRIQKKRAAEAIQLENAKQELEVYIGGFREKSDLAANLHAELEKFAVSDERNDYLQQLFKSTILTELDWQQFRITFEKVHPEFIKDLKDNYPELTQAEIRILVLEKLGMSTQEMANMLGVNRNTINQTKLRLRKKTGEK